MAFAFMQDFPVQDGDDSTANYDAIHKAVIERAPDGGGLIIHTAGFTPDGFRIFEVWESREQCERFMQEVVMPIVMEVAGGAPAAPPTTTTYELYNVYRP